MITPNFFIIGAPKCGTTSLADWLEAHPQICVSHPKEPSYFDTDLHPETARTWEWYLRCFEHRSGDELIYCDATPRMLYSEEALPRILEASPAAKFCVLTRNPVDLCISIHSQFVFSGEAVDPDFETAWRSQKPVRFTGFGAPQTPRNHYINIASTRRRISDLKDRVGAERVYTTSLSLLRNPDCQELIRLCHFLGVQEQTTPLPHSNPGKTARSGVLRRALELGLQLKEAVGIRHSFGVLNLLYDMNSSPGRVSSISDAMREELDQVFADERDALSQP